MKVLIASKISPKYVELLEQVGRNQDVDVNVVFSENRAVIAKEIVAAEMFVTWWSTFDPAYVTQGKQLKWIQTLTAGVDNFLLPEIKEGRIILTSCKGIHGIPMSEHMLGMLLGYMRGLYQIRENQPRKSWERPRVEELFGKTLVIIGLGSIGSELAKRAKAFGMRVIGVKRQVEPVEFVEKVYSSDQLLTAVGEGDVVISILPYTPETYHLISSTVFAHMKNDAIFMSFGRGDVVDEKALIQALETGQIRAALLDVFEDEPLAPASPLWDMKNVFISPHMSALSNLYMERAMGIIAQNLSRYISGEPLLNVVDLTRGY